MPANRKVAWGAVATSVVGAIVTLLGAVEDDTAKVIIIVAVLLCITAIAITFMLGSHHWDALTFWSDENTPGDPLETPPAPDPMHTSTPPDMKPKYSDYPDVPPEPEPAPDVTDEEEASDQPDDEHGPQERLTPIAPEGV